ncbi:Fpg/Nei family DNA glycosylase [Salegentibacter sediminis]|uniref:Fpg/Nei family DNA glycosylase n=1 Tax=Salegentibacter sediminis TaxID=1930251 RepID=UPI0018E397D8|nr:Fpg/Nei family DNA glycosylase [Salegentibacter sediminis]
MPELPEITNFKSFLTETVLDKEIIEVEFPETKLLQASTTDFKKALLNNKFTGAQQLGKYLFLRTNKKKSLVFHFGMTGKFEVYQHNETPKHTHLLIRFRDSSHLAFVCVRKLGKIYLADGLEEFRKEQGLGKHALDLEEDEFQEIVQEKKGGVKSALTDQHFISGIGNVYADEILFQSEVHPKTRVEKLSEKEIKRLFDQMHEVLNTAIKKEGERSEFPSNYLSRSRKEGADCPKCSGKISMIKVSGRSTYFCPKCQKEKS